MPKKSETSHSSAQAETAPKKRRAPVPESAPIPSSTAVSTVAPTTADTSTRVRVTPTRESVTAELNSILETINTEVLRLQSAPAVKGKSKVTGVKFLRTLGKRLKVANNHVARVARGRGTGVKRNSQNGGFNKPVNVSRELSSFAGWNNADMHSRVDVTRCLCSYIKEHNLQDPQNRRFIQVSKDPKLASLLGHKGGDNIQYYQLQQLLKRQGHFLPSAGVAPAVAVPTPAPAPASRDEKPSRREKVRA